MEIRYGDVIGVQRAGGLYDHYGVYENDKRIYEYAESDSNFGRADIHTTTLKDFMRGSGSCFVLIFPEEYGKPAKLEIPVFSAADYSGKAAAYHLYPPEETIQRAKSKLGETKYNLLFNNCEHYAIWCKTGIHESHQIEDLLNLTYKIRAAADIFMNLI